MIDFSDDLAGALHLWTTVDPYSKFPSETIAWRLIPALRNNKYRLYVGEDGCPRGFISWAYMTEQEFESRNYIGEEVFARETGECFVFVDMLAPYGRNDVLSICRDMRRLFHDEYSRFGYVLAHRGQRHGIFPNIGG